MARSQSEMAKERQRLRKENDMPKTEIFRHDDDTVSVVTDAPDERDFVDTFSDALDTVDGNARRRAVRAGFDIVAKLRGYKSGVQERRMIAAGRWPHPSEQPVGTADSGAVAEGADDE